MLRSSLKLAAACLIGLPLLVSAMRYQAGAPALGVPARRGAESSIAPAAAIDLGSYDLRGVDLARRQFSRGLKKKTVRERHRDQSFEGLRDIIRDSRDPELRQFLPAVQRLERIVREQSVDETNYVEGFIRDFAPLALYLERETGLPASVMLAQIIVESGWGGSNITILKNNILGIGNCNEPGEFTAEVDFSTIEHQIRVQCMADTSAYRFESVGESILYYAYLLLNNEQNEKHYGALRRFIAQHRSIAQTDPVTFRDHVIELIANGYHSDPDWYVTYLRQIVRMVDDTRILPELRSQMALRADAHG